MELGLEGQELQSHLYDLLVYEKGGFFLPHRDSQKRDRMVATLVIVLPSSYQGGELVVRHEGQEQTIDFAAQDNPFAIHYAAFYAQKYNLPPRRFSAALLEKLRAWSWPGNVRALRHAVERAVILSEDELLDLNDFPLSDAAAPPPAAPQESARLDAIEKTAITKALESHGGNVSRAAAALGLTRTSLYRRMEKYGL